MSPWSARASRTRLVALAVLLATFAAGALAGVAWERFTHARETAATRFEPGGPGGMRGPGRMIGRRGVPPAIFAPGSLLDGRLDLSDEQHARIDSILREDRAKAGQLLRQMEPRLRARFDSTRARIEQVLTPAQRAEFERFQQERRSRLRERFGRPAPAGGGPPPDR